MRAVAPALSAPAGLTILRCPSCAAAEPVESALLAGEARMIRCRECGKTWPSRAGLPAVVAEPSHGALVPCGRLVGEGFSAEIVADPPVSSKRHGRWPFGSLAGGAVAALVAVAMLACVVLWREAAVAAAPDLAGLYAAVGLPVHRGGLTVEAVSAERRFGDTAAAIRVGGLIVNVGAEARALPPLHIQFRDEGGVILRGARAEAPVASLAPGETLRFLVEVDHVPKEAGDVLVRLGEAR